MMTDGHLHELITRAVTGRAQTTLRLVDALKAEGAHTVLGARALGAQAATQVRDGEVTLQISIPYDVWVHMGDTTTVIHGTAALEAPIALRPAAPLLGDGHVEARLTGTPEITGYCYMGDGIVTVDLEAEVLVEQTGMTRLTVRTADLVQPDVQGAT